MKLSKQELVEFMDSAADVAWMAMAVLVMAKCPEPLMFEKVQDFARKVQAMRQTFELPKSDSVDNLASGAFTQVVPSLVNQRKGKSPEDAAKLSLDPSKAN